MTYEIARYDQSVHEIFQPLEVGKIEALLEEREEKRAAIGEMASFIGGERYQGVVSFFLSQAKRAYAEDLFDDERAFQALDAWCWRKALEVTDIYDIMPQERRNTWNELVTKYKARVRSSEGSFEVQELPPFTEEVVIPTLQHLLASRPQYLAERVDGIFRSLSRNHVTNSPWGFGRRMILENVTDSWGHTNFREVGYIHDLRNVVSKMMGRGSIPYNNTNFVIATLRRDTGRWQDVDGGSLRLRVYKKGTCHIEVHEEIAWRLNAILAILHPRAIPSEHRKPRKTKKRKEVNLFSDLLSFPVIEALRDLKDGHRNNGSLTRLYMSYRWDQLDKHVQQEALNALAAIGGVREGSYIRFDYDAEPVLEALIVTGALPNQKSYQWYPTPPEIALEAVEWAEIGEEHTCLEPSAGQGGIAGFLPGKRTTCVEISPIHVEVLKQKGFEAVAQDFLTWEGPCFDRVIMNPPFSEGRWQEHVAKAFSHLKEDGILVAILPASAKARLSLEGTEIEWSGLKRFPGVSIDLVVAKVRKYS